MRRTMRNAYGFSLIELMIAMTIGLLLLSGLALIFVNSSDANRELQKTGQQIENGRYAVDTLSQDLRLAGFYGHLHDLTSIATPASVPPDPCEASSTANLLSALWYPVQAYEGTIDAVTPASDVAADVSATSCAALTAANLKPGSDVIVIRRVETNALIAADSTTSNAFYIQASATGAEMQLGGGGSLGSCPTAVEHCKADGTTASTLKFTNGASPAPSAPIRRLRVHVYFVAPCSVGTGTASGISGVCTVSDDTIPTLKRLELTSQGTITIVPLVEGVEYLKIQFGTDTVPGTVNLATGYTGDSNVDNYSPPSPASWAGLDWTTVIAAKIHVLARNTESTVGFTDNKTYTLGPYAVPARNDSFKRHVYGAAVQLVNPAGRREIP